MNDSRTSRRRLGDQGETAVCRWLEQQGFAVLGRNLHSRYGELDIVACRGSVLHVVEVKTRRSLAFGTPEEALTAQKRQKILRTVANLQQTGRLPRASRRQVDLACVQVLGDRAEIRVYWNISP